jgi:hypothetical protein
MMTLMKELGDKQQYVCDVEGGKGGWGRERNLITFESYPSCILL